LVNGYKQSDFLLKDHPSTILGEEDVISEHPNAPTHEPGMTLTSKDAHFSLCEGNLKAHMVVKISEKD
jgi:hypothetical protein